MGKYFKLSMRFNRRTADDFGLRDIDGETALNPSDGSVWQRVSLYDYGWGNENGYFRLPLPDFDQLIDMCEHSADEEDAHGAAAVILERYPARLLTVCEELAGDEAKSAEFAKLCELFRLSEPLNRCPTVGVPYEKIKEDSGRWRALSEKAKEIKAESIFCSFGKHNRK